MKILFVCGCLEPGMDGVGDYTTLLASGLSARGHACSLLALADPHVPDVVRGEGSVAGTPMPTLRLPTLASWAERKAQACRFREEIAPDWVSFQVVPYAYHPRGLCFGLGARFAAIAGGCPSEIMFHEIWIGEADGTPFLKKLTGRLQRRIIADLAARVRPRVVHTHTPLYQALLRGLGIHAQLLPLFANISPEGRTANPEWLAEKWPAGWGRILAVGRDACWIFVLFGSIHPEWDGEDFWRRATGAAANAGRSCVFISIGRAGGEATLERLRRHENWLTLNLGAQSPDEISQCLFAADFGVSPVPPEYLGKSGTAMAMLEHGLPVIVARPAYHYRDVPASALGLERPNVVADFGELERLQRTPPHGCLGEIAEQFADDLKSAAAA